jgi:enoyl-CoA hydratase/carnithine racemase
MAAAFSRVEASGAVVTLREDADGVAVLVLNRPHANNAVHDHVYELFCEHLANCARSDAVKAVVVTGAGKFFSSGADLAQGFDPMVGPLKSGRGSYFDPVGKFMSAVIAFPKPLIAAVNGPAIGVGCTLLPHCDVVYCTSKAYMWCPFTNLAVCPEFCSSVTLPAILGPSLAAEMLYLGKRLSAAEAQARGLVSEVLPDGEGFLETVLAKLRPTMAAHNAGRSMLLFKALIKDDAYRARMEDVHRKEMAMLDLRCTGSDSECAQAAAKAKEAAKANKAKQAQAQTPAPRRAEPKL